MMKAPLDEDDKLLLILVGIAVALSFCVSFFYALFS